MKRIGVFGGAFNPLHIGHLINAEFVGNEFNLDKILFIPTKIPPHKKLSGPISDKIRIKMIKKAIKEYPYFEFSDIEIKREKVSYTIDTLIELSKKYPDSKLYLIIGNEWLDRFNTWYRYEDIFKYVKLIILRRVKNKYSKTNLPDFLKKFHSKIIFASNPVINISSTYIRKLIRKGFNIKYMVPEVVRKYIKKYNLYIGEIK